MKFIRFLITSISLLAMIAMAACAPSASKSLKPIYISPLANADLVSTGETIAVRFGPPLTPRNVAGLKFSVAGSQSGVHAGQTILADDHRTVIFKPTRKFSPGETVKVSLNSLRLSWQKAYAPLDYSFTVAKNQKPGGVAQAPAADSAPKSAFPNFLTVPQDIPHFTVNNASPTNDDGYIFVAPFYWTKSTVGSYLLILTTGGKLVYYQDVGQSLAAFDFKVLPNGLIAYFDQKRSTYFVMDSHYEVVNSYQTGNGYTTDLHDMQLLSDGFVFLMSYDDQTVDMSKIAPGGKADATVEGLIIQELDPSKNVIFEWRSWDHFKITDTTSLLTDQKVDYVHGNALAVANDGNLLLSSRNMSEVTKINVDTGEVMWRFGGKANQFKLIGGQPFAFQHDIRQLPNGNLTIFDNQGTQEKPAASSAIEYKLDETNMTATQVWSFTHTPPVFGTFMGNTERLDNGSTFISWGAALPKDPYAFINMTEVGPDNTPIFDLSFDQPYVSYRAFLAPWKGVPNSDPTIVFKPDGNGLLLGYSWNGATEVASYQVFGGSQPLSLKMIDKQANDDFEMQTHLDNVPIGECYFQVAALDKSGNELGRSKVITTDNVKCPLGY